MANVIPSYIVFSSSDVENVPMLSNAQTFTGVNTFTQNIVGNVTGTVTGASSLNVLKAGDTMTGQLISTLAIGTSPFAVTSTTVNTNLNADMVDGKHLGYVTVVTKTADYTALTTDQVIVCNKATAMTITLPAATGGGQTYAIANIGVGAVTLEGNSSDTINGELNQTIDQWACLQCVDYAANKWVII